jgi:hypothetical protein
MAGRDFVFCGNGFSSMLDFSCLQRLGKLSTNSVTASPKTRKSQLYIGANTIRGVNSTYARSAMNVHTFFNSACRTKIF